MTTPVSMIRCNFPISILHGSKSVERIDEMHIICMIDKWSYYMAIHNICILKKPRKKNERKEIERKKKYMVL